MTNREITEVYLKHKGKGRASGTTDALTAILPFVIMDACYQLYTQRIAPIECSTLLKKYKNQWASNYNRFNSDFFFPFNEEQTEYIVDKMDSFEEYISHHITVCKLSVQKALAAENLPLAKREVLATCMMCNVLAQSAQCIWGRVYKNRWGNPECNNQIKGVEKATMGFMNTYDTYSEKIDLNQCPEVVFAMEVLCKKIIAWLADDYNRQK